MKCCRCGNEKEPDQFYKSKQAKHGRRHECIVCSKAYEKKHYAAHKRAKYRVRMEVISHYSGGRNACACCGEPLIEFLTIDHIDGGGNKHRKEVGKGSQLFCYWLRKNNYPNGYQVLCCNCNYAKHFYKVCPHQREALQ